MVSLVSKDGKFGDNPVYMVVQGTNICNSFFLSFAHKRNISNG